MEKIEYKGYTIKIEQDDFSSESPREWSNLGKLCLFHNRYDFPNESGYNPKNYNNWTEFLKDVTVNENPAVLLAVRMYDHSGISLTCDTIEKNRYPYTCPWDSGQVGFIYATKEDVRKEFKVKRISPQLKQKIYNQLVQEVKTFSQWANGEIYYYWIEDSNGENIGSCGGFYGWDIENNGLMEYAKDESDSHIESLKNRNPN